MSVIPIILQGAITGIILTLSFGAGFFALIQTSLNNGYKKGLLIALGAIICDIVYMGIALFATSFVTQELPKYSNQIKLIALIAFVIMGISSIVKSNPVQKVGKTIQKANYYYISKGIILNMVNPLVLITWLGITVFLESTYNYGIYELILYFTATLLSTFATQSAICLSSHQIKDHLSVRIMHRFNIIIGIFFIGVAFYLYFGNASNEGMEKAKDWIK